MTAVIERTTEFKINMGNYETHTERLSVQLEVPDDQNPQDVIRAAEKIIRTGLRDSLVRAANISDVRNTYILTWLEEDNG